MKQLVSIVDFLNLTGSFITSECFLEQFRFERLVQISHFYSIIHFPKWPFRKGLNKLIANISRIRNGHYFLCFWMNLTLPLSNQTNLEPR